MEEREREGGSRGMPKTRVGKPRGDGRGRDCPLSEIINAPVYSTVLGLEGFHLLVSQGIGHKS